MASLGALTTTLDAQPREDRRSQQHWEQGISLFANGQFNLALKQFEEIQERKFNLLTTPALYMTGLCWYSLDDAERGIDRFQRLIIDYPMSVYIDEASYHKALLMLRLPEQRLGGLYVLTKLIDSAADQNLQKDALNAYRNYLYNKVDSEFLISYYAMVRVREKFADWVHEALCIRLYKEKKYELLDHFLEEYRAERGKLTPRLNRLVVKVPSSLKARHIKVALFLPFNSNIYQPILPNMTLWSVEMLAGVRLALGEMSDTLGSHIDLKVLDTQDNKTRTQDLIKKELADFKPDLIIGDIMNGPSKIISEYAEKNEVPQVIPVSPVKGLVDGKKFVYLANPSMPLQMQTLAQHAIGRLRIGRYLLLGDGTNLSKVQMKEFGQVLKDSSRMFTQQVLSENYELEQHNFRSIISQIKTQSVDGVLIASDNESLVAFILKQFETKNVLVTVLGSSDWNRFQTIDNKLLVLYNATFACSYFTQNDPMAFSRFEENFRKAYPHRPSRYAALGYDIPRFFLKARYDNPDGAGWKQALPKTPPFKGLAQNYYYAGGQDNQAVQLLQFRESGLEKVRTW